MNHVEWSTKTAVTVGMATILSLVMVMNDPKVCLAGDQFNVGFGYRPGGYAVNGRGQYGYNHGGRSAYYRHGQNRLAPYGNGPYGYGNATGYSGWNSNYNSYYNSKS